MSRPRWIPVALVIICSAIAGWLLNQTPSNRPVFSINEFSVSGLSVGSGIETVHAKLGQPLASQVEYGIEFLFYYDPRLSPLKHKQPGNTFVGLDVRKTVVRICGSSLRVKDRNLNSFSNYPEVTALLSAVGAPKPLEYSMEKRVYSLHYTFPDGKLHIGFTPSGHGTSYTLERTTTDKSQIP